MKKQVLQTSFVLTLSLLVSVALVPQAFAEDSTTVTGNGAESTNQVATEHSNTTQVQSTNEMTVSNSVKSQATTGGNSASQNTTGDTKIVTGDAQITSEVTNEGNVTVVNAGCCESTTTATTVTGNGAGSENKVTKSATSTTSVTVLNNATITNNISIKANTGNNKADFNTGGNTIIKTGDIKVQNKVINGPVNVTKVKVKGNETINSHLKIAGYGVFTENDIVVNEESVTVTNTDNFTTFFNNVEALMNTGNNSADYNTGGETIIVTGDIDAKILIENIANFNFVEVACGCDKEKPNKPEKPHEEIPSQPSSPAPPTTSVGGPGGPGSSGPGSSNGSSSPAPTTLPVTGNNALFFMLLANVMMFFLGMYLRLRSGRSPGYSFAL